MPLDFTDLPAGTYKVRTFAEVISPYTQLHTVVRNTGTVPVTIGGPDVTPGASTGTVVAPGASADVSRVSTSNGSIYAVAAAAGELAVHRVTDHAQLRDFTRAQVAAESGVPKRLLDVLSYSARGYEDDVSAAAAELNAWRDSAA